MTPAEIAAAAARAACAFVTDWRVARQLTRQLPAGVGTSARLLYVLLAGHLNPDGLAWPSIDTLAGEMGCHVDTTRRARSELERHGLIVTTPGGGRAPNLYRLTDFRMVVHSPAPATPATPRADAGGQAATPRARADDPPRTRRRPPAPARDKEGIEEVIEERGDERFRRRWTDAASRRAWIRQFSDMEGPL